MEILVIILLGVFLANWLGSRNYQRNYPGDKERREEDRRKGRL